MSSLFSLRSVFPRLFGIRRTEKRRSLSHPLFGKPIEELDLAAPFTAPPASKEHPDVNPLVEILLNAQSDAERALWLLRVPLSFVVKRHEEINKALRAAKYHNGLNYIALLLAILSQRRDDDGFHSKPMSLALDRAAVSVRIDARRDPLTGLANHRDALTVLGPLGAAAGSEKA